MRIRIPTPALQIDFATRLMQSRTTFLQAALGIAVSNGNIRKIDSELSDLTNPDDLAQLAARGIRGEWLFACPSVLQQNPRLLAYYRLVLGFSQKEFYTQTFGTVRFRRLEFDGVIMPQLHDELPELCRQLNAAASVLARAIGFESVTRDLLDDLSLLTLGPQFRGGANVRRGVAAIGEVFSALRSIVAEHLIDDTAAALTLRNAAGRSVKIQLAADPDIVIVEISDEGSVHKIVAIEVKGGTDFSNIHNRVGEAEKSHQKARNNGFTECWTVINVDATNIDDARRESPSTDRFFLLSDILNQDSPGFRSFRERIVHLTSIPGHRPAPRKRRYE